ncbi:MAG TPA: hypothetical protein VJ551_01470 [Nitrososphaeraceae archaeon]|nr:hypothetical protein [Nitrososphaeraceae archaeon]
MLSPRNYNKLENIFIIQSVLRHTDNKKRKKQERKEKRKRGRPMGRSVSDNS